MAAVAAVAALLAWRSQSDEAIRAKESERLAREEALAVRDESTLFQLISLLRQTVSAIDIHMQAGKIKTGHDALAHILSRITYDPLAELPRSFIEVYSRYRNDLAHYLRLSYNIFAFIDSSRLSNKRFYAKIVRALFSDAELALIALNCSFGEGKAKYKPLVEKYCLLNNLNEETIRAYNLEKLFSPSAFEHTSERAASGDGENPPVAPV